MTHDTISNGSPTWPRDACDDCCKDCFNVLANDLLLQTKKPDAVPDDPIKAFHACCDACERAYVAAMARGR